MANDSHYETWLAKQEAMGRTVPVTTSPYSPPRGNRQLEKECSHPGCAFKCEKYNPAPDDYAGIVTALGKAAPQ